MRNKLYLLLLLILSFQIGQAQSPGNCLNFDGTNDNVSLPNSLTQAVSNQTAITIEYWFKGSNLQSAVRFQDVSTNSYIVAGWNNMHIISTDGTTSGLSVGAAATDGKWHHIAMTWQKNTTNGFKSYLDGVLVAQRNSANANLPTMTSGGYLGQYLNAEYTTGSLDEVKIYNTALTQSEIQTDMFNSPTTSLPSSLLAYYRMNQGTAGATNTGVNTLTDQTSNAYNGTLNNFSLSGSGSNWVESYAMVVPTAPNITSTTTSGFTANWTAPTVGTVDNYLLDVSTDPAFGSFVTGFNGLSVGNVTSYTVNTNTTSNLYWRVRASKTSASGQSVNTSTATVNAIAPGSALNFDGTNDNINLPYYDIFAGNFTIETWIKSTSSVSRSNILSWGKNVVGSNSVSEFRLAGSKLQLLCNGSGSITSNASVNTGKWIHVAVVKNGTTYSLYINGVLDGTGSWTYTGYDMNTASIGVLYYSGALYSDSYFPGSMDEMRLWNVARTQSQIQANMNNEISASTSGLLHYYKFNSGSGTALIDEVSGGSSLTLSNFALTGSTSNWVESYAMVVPTSLSSTAATANGFTANWDVSSIGSATSYVIDVATDAAFTSIVSGYNAKNVGNVTSTTVTGLANSTTYYWRVRADKTSVTGTGNNAPYQTVSTTFQKPGQALNFDGTDDRVQASGTQPSTNMTVEAWIKTSGATLQEIVEFGSSTTSKVTEFRLNNSNKLYIGTNGNTVGATYTEIGSNATITTGKWTHVAVVKTGTSYSLYINGVLDITGTLNYVDPTTDRINIGSFYSSGTWFNNYSFNGSIDEVRIWSTARTASEIQANMYDEISPSASGLVHYYNFNNSVGGTTLNDAVTTGTANATLTNFALSGTTSNWVESYAMVMPSAPNTTAISATGFTANWTAPTVGTVENYLLDVSTDPAFGSFVSGFNALNVGNVTSYTVATYPTTNLYWRVRAEKSSVTGQGGYSAVSTVVAQAPGGSLNFDGSNDYINTNTGGFGNVGGTISNFTLECWIKPTAADNDGAYHGFLGAQSASGRSPGIWVLSNKVHCSESSGNMLTSVAVLNQDKWNHVAWVKNGASNNLYINGVFAGSWTTTASSYLYTNYTIGYIDNYFAGNIDEVRFWNTSLPLSTIQANMFNEVSASSANLLHYYKFNSATGATLVDAVASGASNGTLNNFALTGSTSNWTESYAMVVPTNFSTTNATATGFTANWAATVAGYADSYLLDVSTSPSFDTFVSGFNGLNVGSVTTYAVTGLTNTSNSYYWRVRANKTSVNGQGYMPSSGVLGLAATTPGNALSFDGSNDNVYLPDRLTTALTTTNNTAITIEYWFKGSNAQSAVRFNDNSNFVISGWGTVGSQIHAISTDGGTSNGLSMGAAITDGKWHHVAMTWQKNTVNGFKSYLDGQLVAQRTSANVNLPAIVSNYGYMGTAFNGNEPLNGSLDEVRLYTVARTQAEIQADMYSTATTNLPTGLLAYYKMDQGTAAGTNTGLTGLYDQSGFGHTGIMANFALTGTSSNWVESYAEITPTNTSSTNPTVTGFTANWAAPTYGTLNSYVIDVATDTAFTNIVSGYNAKNVGNVTTTNITGLGNGTPYYWRVRADKTSVTGTGNNTIYQTATTVFQKPGQALNFDGSNDYVGIGNSGSLTGSNPFAIELWAKTTSSSESYLVQQRDSGSTIGEYVLEMLANGTVQLWLFNTSIVSVTSSQTINDGKWHHIAATRESDQSLRIYIDGILSGNAANSSQPLSTFYVAIGKDYRDNSRFFNGSIDEVRIWNTGRTQAQIQASMYDEISASTSGLAHYYNFNATSGTTLTDAISSGSANGTLNNFALSGSTSNWVESYAMVNALSPTTTSVTNAAFTANWTAPTVGTVDNYVLDVATDANFTSYLSGYTAKNIGTVTSYTITGLEQATNYYWRVRTEKASVTAQSKYTVTQTVATSQEPLNLSSTTTTNTFNLLTNAAITVDPNVTINYTHNITGFNVVISNGKQSGDVLSYTGTLPSGVTAASYNSSTGVLSFTGTTTPANWQTLLRTVTFRAYTNANTNRSISFSAGSLYSFNNGHYYELVSTSSTWATAKAAAASRKYLNYTGYLATVTSQAENDYIKQTLVADAWMGASDDYTQINTATGATTYANQSTAEGHWYWVTGPEAGTQFTSTNYPITPVSGRYNNWYSGEPNNGGGNEHYGQFYSSNNGTWNDWTSTGTIGYVVEYGGLSNDITQTPSYSLTMSVTATPPGNAMNFDGTNDYIYTSAAQSNPTTFTLEAWFNTTTTSGGGIVGLNDTTANSASNYDRFIWMGSDGKINFGVHNGSSNILTSANAYNDGKYHHVAATFSTSVGMKLYLDGVLVGSNNLSSVTSYSGVWKIGGFTNWGPSVYFNGTIDEVRIWSTVRSQAEITSNMLTPLASNSSGLTYYYTFDNGIPSGTNTGLTTLYSQTTNANNGVLSGFALSGSTSNWIESYAMVEPVGTTTAITSSGFTANWSAPTLGTFNNYILEVSTNSGFTSFVSGYNNKNVGSSTSFDITGLSPFSTYYWRVRADKTSVTGKGGSVYQTVITAKEPINVTSTTTTNTFNLLTNTAIVVDPNVTVNYSQNINGFRVLIGTNKQDGDVLSYTGSLPSGVTATAYNSSTGVLAFSGTTSAANWQALLRSVTFRAYKNSSAPRSISFSAGTLNSFSNGHFYELVTTTDSWTNSKAAAASRTYLNYQGYLTTVTSQAENDFIKQILSADAWMGASDSYSQINTALGTNTYANQSASEGKWYWVTGPEAGTQFMTSNGGTNVVAGKYANWYTGSNEPNNYNGSEDYGQYTSTQIGTWNDLANTTNLGYIVEYGGMATDIVQTPSYTVTMNVAATEPGNALNLDGTDDYVNIPDTNSLDLTTNYTIEAWVKPETFSNLAGIVSKYQTGSSFGYTLRLNGTAPYTGIDFDEKSTANGILTANKWYHIAAVKNGSTRTLYVNGVSVALTGTGLTTAANTDPVKIGCDFSARYFDGNIDEVRIWSVARSQSEIVANMNTPIAPSTANLVSYYNFNQFLTGGTNTGLTSLYDQTTTLNNGTLTNFGLTSTSTSNWVESYAMVVPTTNAATSKYSLGFTANWTAPTLGTTEKYYLDVATDAAFTSLVSGYSNKDVGTVTSYAINTGITASTTYYYRVRSEKASVTGSGGYSNTTIVTTNPTETLVANAASDRTSTSFTANWSAPAIHNITNYTLDVSTNNTFTAPISGSPFTVAGLSQNITGLTPNTNYYYRIRVTGYNNSNIINASTFAPFAAIATSASNACLNTTSPVVTFTGSGSTAPYTFVYTLNGGANQTISTTSGNSVTLSVPTSTAGNYTYVLVNVTDANNGTNTQTGTVSINVNSLPTPSFTATPDTTICSNVNVTYTTQSGQTNYVWNVPGTLGTDYTITSGGTGSTSSTVTLKWLSSGSKTVTVNYANSSNCTSSAASTITTVNSTPTVAAITGTTTTTVGLSTTLSDLTANGVWTSSNPTVASINSNGVVTAIGQGTSTISYTVTTGSCSNVATTTYTVNAAPTPTITTVSPTLAVVGATITITGTNFLGASTVTIGSYQTVFTIVSATTITATVPQGTGSSLAVSVTTPGGTVTTSSPNLFTFNTAGVPTITSFSPTSAGAGQTVVITGTNLLNPSSITFGGTDVASYTVNSSTQITVTIGSGTTGTVSVTTPGGTGTRTGFTFLTCGGNPTIYAGGSMTMCSTESPISITNYANASNYTALTWTTSGTGTFANNTTATALTTATYTPSIADITAGTVTLTLTATANTGCNDAVDTKVITIYAAPIGGTISGSTAVCTGTNSTTLTLNGSSGSISKWQSSTTSDFSSNITDINNTTSSYTATNLTASTYYRAILTSGTCSDAYSAVATITVDPVAVAGTISGATTVCTGTNSTTLTLNGSSGNIQWQSSTNNSNFTNISGQTDTTYTATNLSVSKYYRAVITSGSCASATTESALITVSPTSASGTISGATSVCAGTNSTTLTLNDSVGTIQWQYSTDNNSFNSIVGATNDTYTATNLTATTYYRAVVTSGACSADTSSSAVITVSPTSVAGTISGETTVCSGTNSTTLTLNNAIGNIQWQSSTNNSTFNNINGATATTFNVVGLTQTTYYRAVVTSGVCSATTTSSVTMNVSPTSVAGTISGATTVCANANSTQLSLSGNTGSIQWQSSTDNDTFNNISGATSSTYTATNLTETTYYRVIVTSGVCNYTTTATVNITVDQSPVSGSVSGTATICTGTNSALLSLSGSQGTIQWQYSTNGSTYNNIVGANGSTYTATNLTSTTYYRATLSNGVCNSVTTNVATLTVSPTTVAGTISGATTVCANSNSTQLSLSGSTGSIQWQSSTNNNTFSNISGATSSTYTATNLTATTYYRAVVVSGACSSATTTSATITVNPISVSGTVSGGTTVCYGTNTTNLVLAGNTGAIQWQSSTNNSTFSDISGATNSMYNATDLTTTTYYRAKITNGVCNSVYTNSTTITINSGSLVIGTLGSITGLANLCGVNSTTYTVQPVTGAAYYNWTLPSGATSSSTNGNSVTVTFDSSFHSGIISVKAINACGIFSNSKSMTITNKAPNISISGSTSVCGKTTVVYSASNIANTYYSWSVPNGITILTGDGTNTIQASIDNTFASGTISVTASTSCGDSTANLAIFSNTQQPQSITGTTQLCGYSNSSVTYATPSIAGVTSYNWSVPVDATIVSGQGTNTINVSFPTSFTTGSIGVALTGTCGTGPQKSITVTSSLPKATITGPAIICNSSAVTYDTSGNIVTTVYGTETYSVPTIAGATSYQWTVPAGVTIVSGQNTNSITISANLSVFTTGNVTIAIQNSCGSITTSTFKISKYSTAATITGTTDLCSASSVSYSVPSTIGTNFNWNVPSWMTISSGQNTSSITVAITGAMGQGTVGLSFISNCNTNESISLTVGCSKQSQVQSSQCGITLGALNTTITATYVTSATNYRFEVTNGNTVRTIDSQTKTFNLTQLSGGALYGMTYSIRVAVQLNGIWQAYGYTCTVSTPAITATQIQNSQCGTTLAALNTIISANNVVVASAYRFEVTIGNNVRTYDSSTKSFNLSQLSGGVLYGETYSIRVAIQCNGTWQAYGSACTVSTPAIPFTKVQASQCGSTLTSLNGNISADNVVIANGYRFEVTNGSNVRTYDSSTRSFNLTQLNGGTLYGMTYSIRVAIKYNNVWQAYGSSCNISTPAIPSTQVQATQCGTTLATLGTSIYANTVTIATGYRFEVTNGATVRTYESSIRSFKLTQLSGTITNGTTYSIRVAIQYNGVWQDFGNSCQVYTPGIAKSDVVQPRVESVTIDQKESFLKAYPNPFADTFVIQMSPSGSNELIDITIYDMLGSLVKRMNVEEQNLNYITIGEEFPSGVYNVIMTQGNTSKSVRVIKR